jgi:hypothetical protein
MQGIDHSGAAPWPLTADTYARVLTIARTIFETEDDLCFALGALVGIVANLGPRLTPSERDFLATFLRRTADEVEAPGKVKLQ